MRRIVVTGRGLVSPLGCGSELAWSRSPLAQDLPRSRNGLLSFPHASLEWLRRRPTT